MKAKKHTRKHWVFGISLPLVFALDQATKAWVERTVPLYESIIVVPGLFNITHVKNTGVAFGLFAGHASTLRTLFFGAITLGALMLILLVFRTVKEKRILAPLCLGMIMAGALGNLVDRIRWGFVIDFMDLHWKTYHWPAFNVADSAITVGILLVLMENLLLHRKTGLSQETGAKT
jgi:signal peptidase II